jgi:mannose-6-phosphate isomerase-like protein (cupin superfamily)
VNVNDIPGNEIAPGVIERVLLKPNQSKPGGLGARHYVLTKGGQVFFEESLTEYQHYVVQGCAKMNGINGDLLHQDSAWFLPCTTRWMDSEPVKKHSLVHGGKGEVRVLTLSYKVPRPAFRWAKSRINNLYKVPQYHSSKNMVGYTQLFKEEDHAVMGALRMHGVDIQTNTPGITLPNHRNPEEIMYFLRGKGIGVSGDVEHEIRAGSFLYTPEGDIHGISKVDETLQYLVAEFIHHDKMWTERAYSKDWKSSLEWEQKLD